MQIPSRKRVDKLTTVLKDPANKFDLRLKQISLEYRLVAHIIARSEAYGPVGAFEQKLTVMKELFKITE